MKKSFRIFSFLSGIQKVFDLLTLQKTFMILQSPDTHPKAEEIQLSLIRQASVPKRISRMRSLSKTVIQLSRRAILRTHPKSDEQELNLMVLTHNYGADLAGYFNNHLKKQSKPMNTASDMLAAIEPVTAAFEALNIPYYIGGSIASSAYGIPRATLDVDMVADLKPQHVSSLIKMLGSTYYIDEEMILDAIHRKFSFNLIHLETMMKIDIFILKDSPYGRESFKRKRKDTLDEENNAECYFTTPEDIILNKLEWFRMGGNVSERQWHDVLGVLKIQKNELDMEYLRCWASELHLTNLLEQALDNAGI